MLQEIRKVNQGQNYMVEGRIRNGQKTSNFFYGRSLGGLVLIPNDVAYNHISIY